MAKKSKRLGIHKILQDKEEIKALIEAGRLPENEKFVKNRDNALRQETPFYSLFRRAV